jgi:hypothetical protein
MTSKFNFLIVSFLLTILSQNNLTSQTVNNTDSIQSVASTDSVKEEKENLKNSLLLRGSLWMHSAFRPEYYKAAPIQFEEQKIYIPITTNIPLSLKIKSDLKYSIEMMRKFNSVNDLGVISDILGYTNAAAAFGLAAYHLYKYEIKKKK